VAGGAGVCRARRAAEGARGAVGPGRPAAAAPARGLPGHTRARVPRCERPRHLPPAAEPMSQDPNPFMDALIERALSGEASEEELARLAAWRGAAPENERQYRRTERLARAARAPRAAADPAT